MANRLVKPPEPEKSIMNTLLSISFNSEFNAFFNTRPLAVGPFIHVKPNRRVASGVKLYCKIGDMRQTGAGGLNSYHFIVKTG